MAGGEGRLRVQVLGPIRLRAADGADLTPAGPLQRRLLSLLVLCRGRLVTVDAAVEALWPRTRPDDPAAALQNHLSRLRRGLRDGVIGSVGEGYRLDPAALDLDSDRLEAAVRQGSAVDATALAELEAVLDRWQGPAYPELEELDEGRAEATRLAELRTRALEVRAEARLARGEAGQVVAGLAALAEEHPLRERPRALLMTALAATGRQAEALGVYDDFRRLLAHELGIEPSPALAAQYADLLAGTVPGPAAEPVAPVRRLPVPATSLLGREDLAAELTDRSEAARLVTLVGPGGVGKTRLLLELGHRLRSRRPDRPVVLCELAVADPESTVYVVAAAVGVDARPGVPLVDRVADVLGDGEVVLLVDNCEHVLDAAAALADRLLARCPQVRLVATSRERLRVAGEEVHRVPTLAAEQPDAPAVRLFVERARAVVPGFDPDADDVRRIGAIARRLDGLPLAIELAAARLHTHDVGEVAAGLDHRFSLLSTGYRGSTRHGSLAAAVAWSVDLLDDDLRRIFTDLSVFSGPFAVSDAAAVCGADADRAADALADLVERSLVLRAPDRRYVLLETLRAYGAEQLEAIGRADLVAERHARHQVDWCVRTEQRLVVSGERALADLDAALPELWTGLGWLLGHDEVELAGTMMSALLYYGLLRLRPDVLLWADRVLDADPEDRSRFAAQLRVSAAYAAWMAGDVEAMGTLSARALEIAASAESTGVPVPSEAWTGRGSYELFLGNLEQAAAHYWRGRMLAPDRPRELMAWSTELLALGYAADASASHEAELLLAELGEDVTAFAAYGWYCAGEAVLGVDARLARDRLSRALELADATRASFVTGIAGASRASIDARVGDPEAAAREYRWLIPHWQRAGMWSTQWTMLRAIAGLLARLGRDRDAAVLEGAVRGTAAGHRIFGADAVALDELSERLRAALGEDDYRAALRHGAALDGEAAIAHALRAL